jgi:hypothetical protein
LQKRAWIDLWGGQGEEYFLPHPQLIYIPFNNQQLAISFPTRASRRSVFPLNFSIDDSDKTFRGFNFGLPLARSIPDG